VVLPAPRSADDDRGLSAEGAHADAPEDLGFSVALSQIGDDENIVQGRAPPFTGAHRRARHGSPRCTIHASSASSPRASSPRGDRPELDLPPLGNEDLAEELTRLGRPPPQRGDGRRVQGRPAGRGSGTHPIHGAEVPANVGDELPVGRMVGGLDADDLPGNVLVVLLCAGFALGCGAVLVLTALDPWFWGVPPLLVLAGASMTISNTAANSLLQATASPRLLGQTVSLYMLAMRGGISVGSLLTGSAVSLLGVRHAFLLNGVLALIFQAALAREWLRAPRV